jgi:ATP-binding cassette subfamily B protein
MTAYTDDEDITIRRLDVSLWRRILSYARPYRRPLTGMSVAGMALAVCDVLLTRIPGAVIDDAIARGGENIWFYAGSYAALSVTMSVLVCIFIVLAGRTVTGVAYDLRRTAFARLQELSFSFYDNRPVGWLMARLTADCDRISSVLPWTLLDAAWGMFLLSGITIVMLWMNWKLALVVLAIVPPLSIATAVYQKKLIRTQRLARKTNSRITASFNEAITGVRTTKAFVREEENLKEFQTLTGEMFGHSLRSAVYSAVYLPVVITLGATGVGLALWRGGLLTGSGLDLGELVAFMQYAGLFHIPIQEMAERFTGVQSAQASAERLMGLLDTRPQIVDSPDALAGPDRIREVVFEHVDFAYKNDNSILTDFCLTIRAGESIALVGETGSGKSTVARLLCRFYEPTGGCIRIDGIDYRKRSLHWLQSNLGIVLQEPHLFSGTVRENIRYGRLDATDAEVEAVARQVGAADFIAELSDGYATEVGEGGNRLSTGQKQFVSLARALLADPQILVLDEATSSVDTETERRIQKGIEKLIHGRISLIIAHRLSTIRAADRILVIDRGRIVEEGNHAALIGRHGPYARLYAQQFRRDVDSLAIEKMGT